jgi:hypothetical protein
LAFYQIGAVLHDLLKKKTIFEEFLLLYPRMVEAVKYATPDLNVPGADPDLVALAQSCLVKDPATRLKLVTWESFTTALPPVSAATIKDRVKKRQARVASVAQEEPAALNRKLVLNDLLGRTSTMIRDECLTNDDVFPPVEVHDHPLPDADVVAFRAAFPRSNGKGLQVSFALLFYIRLLDVAANIVEIRVAASVSGDVRRFPPEGFSSACVLYRGPFGEERVKARIDFALYTTVDAVSAQTAMNHDETRPLSIVVPERTE